MNNSLAIADGLHAPSGLRTGRASVRSANELRRAMRDLAHGACPPDTSGLDRVLHWDPSRSLVETQSGTTWRALAEQLAQSVPELAGFADETWLPATVGQSLSENSIGPDGRPISAHIEAIALATPDGQLRRASRRFDPELFALAVGGHGVFGVPYSVTLRANSLVQSAARRTALEVLELAPAEATPTRCLRLFIPPQRLERFLAEARTLAAQWRLGIARVEVRSARPESETRLCWAQREYAAVALHLHTPCALGATVRAIQARRAVLAAAIAHDGSFDLGSGADATCAQVEACYPMMHAFLAEKRRCDPAERLQNDWYRHYRTLLGRRPDPVNDLSAPAAAHATPVLA